MLFGKMGGLQLELYNLDIVRANQSVGGRDSLRRAPPSHDVAQEAALPTEASAYCRIESVCTVSKLSDCIARSRFLP